MPPLPRPGRIFRRLGWLVAAIGLAVAAILFARSAKEADPVPRGYLIVAGAAYPNDDSAAAAAADRQAERLGGRALARAAVFDRWIKSMFEGRHLAGTLAVLSLSVAAGFVYLAGLADEGDDEADEDRTGAGVGRGR